MKAVRLTEKGDLDGLKLVESDTPSPPPYHVLVRMRAAALNYRDLAAAYGRYPGAQLPNVVVLSDGAGEVAAVGEGVTRCRVKDRVSANCNPNWIGGEKEPRHQQSSFGFSLDGMLADYVVVSEEAIVHLPAYMSFEEGASLPCAATSAWNALVSGPILLPGQFVLTMGTGGVSLFALQLAQTFGARVVATSSSRAKCDFLTKLGAFDTINYRDVPAWGEKACELTGGVGVHRVIEIGGAGTIQNSIGSTRIGGCIALIGFVAGFDKTLSPMDIMMRSTQIFSVGMGSRQQFEAMLMAMEAHKVRPVIDQVFPMNDFKAGFRRLESGQHMGKVIIAVE